MKNKLTDNDPRLTAYALGELPRAEAEEIARILDAPLNGPLKREVKGIDALGVMLTQTLSEGTSEDLNLKLSPSQRDAIFRSAKAPTVADVSSTHQSAWLRPVLVTLAAAAVVTISFMVMNNVDTGDGRLPDVSYSGLSDDKLQAPIQPSNSDWEENASVVSSQGVGGEVPSHDLSSNGLAMDDDRENLIKLVENDWVNRADKAVSRLPLVCGKASWNWVKHSIEVDGVLPDKNVVRVEEILNAFSYDEPSDLELSHVNAGVELVECPWDAERMVAIILIKNTHADSIQIESAVTFSGSVEKYRLIGYAKAEKTEQNIIAPAQIIMGAGDSHIVMYEIETATDIETAADVLSLNVRTAAHTEESNEWIHDDQTLKVQFSERSWTKLNKDAKFALILADWCRVITSGNHSADNGVASVVEMIKYFEENHDLTEEQAEGIKTLRGALELMLGFSTK